MSVKPQLLFVDPNPSLHEIMGEILSQKLDVEFANDIDKALKKSKSTEFNLIITELDFPDGDALEFIKTLKRVSPNTLIVVMTGHATAENAISALRLGAIDFIKKPFSIEDIAQLIEKFFSLATNKPADYQLLDTIVEEKRTFVLPTDFMLINTFLNELITVIRRFEGIDKKTLLIVRLALYEMLVNAMEHGNLEIDYEEKARLLDRYLNYHEMLNERAQQPPFDMRKVRVSYHYSENTLTFNITDEGRGFDVSKIPSPRDESKLEQLSGRGIFITRVNMDEIYYNEKGNSVTMVKKLSPS